MFGLVNCNASSIARLNTDADLFFVRLLVKNWLWPIITFFGVTGNILAVIVLTKRRMIMSSTNNYLVALALVDIAYLVLTLIINTLQNPCFQSAAIADIVLTVCRPIADFSSNSSVWLTVTFTVERWVAITYPLQSRTWCTVHRARKIILSVLCAAVLCTLPSAFEMKFVRRTETIDRANTRITVTRIRAVPTALGNSLLYHRIYFNFVTFAFIWIPLLLLLVFNTVLIYYVHRSKKSKQETSEGVQLRRHSRGNQGEQRKTTIMLIAVVLVFTVCQIPQAISLTLHSFFPTLARTPKVLIYNNFANCCVALNASINFLLYCCFSDRFRSTFRSNFVFLSKYWTHYLRPKCLRTEEVLTHSPSYDNVSLTHSVTNQSNYSISVAQATNRISNLSTDIVSRSLITHVIDTPSARKRDRPWLYRFVLLSRLKSSKRRDHIQLKETHLSQSTDSLRRSSAVDYHRATSSSIVQLSSSPTLSVLKRPSISVHRTSNLGSPGRSEHAIPNERTPINLSLTHRGSSSLHVLTQPTLQPRTRSFRDEAPHVEPVWIKRRLSNSTIDRQRSSSAKEIVDVTV